ncbi:MAG: beta-lactamase family protein [Thermomicrobia bacterium]|nr:beta-lactamase family protein [Thermomicrobia bacterium]
MNAERPTQSSVLGTRHSLDPELHAMIEAAMAHYHVPGVAVGVYHDGAEQTGGFGVTNVDHPLAVDARTLYQIGSITKTFVGTAAMRLVEQGKLALDAPIRSYLPDLRLADAEATERATMQHLLTHTGGWVGDYFDDLGAGDDALAKMAVAMADVPQVAPIGTLWSYNNAGFYLAGRVIEVLTGQPFDAAVQSLILGPLGMRHTYFFARNIVTERFAVGHSVKEGVPTVARPWELPRTANPAGGLLSDVRDMLIYARFHMGDGTAQDGTRVLSPESLAFMQSPLYAKGSDGEMGLTWMLQAVGGVRTVRHSGGTVGQQTTFVMVPSRNFALTILTNADRGSELHGGATKWMLKQYLGLSDPEPAPLDASAEQLAPYVGRYTAAGSDIELTMREGGLMLQRIPKGGFPNKEQPAEAPPPPVRAALWGENLLIALDEPMQGTRGEFLRDPNGAITWLRLGSRAHRRVG